MSDVENLTKNRIPKDNKRYAFTPTLKTRLMIHAGLKISISIYRNRERSKFYVADVFCWLSNNGDTRNVVEKLYLDSPNIQLCTNVHNSKTRSEITHPPRGCHGRAY